MRGARRTTLLFGAALAAGAMLPACNHEPQAPDYRDVAPDPVSLMDAFESYETVDAVRATVVHATLLEEFEQEARSGAPAYEQVMLQVVDWFHLDHGGVLNLEFFNDRLLSVVFYPRQAETYSGRLRDVLTARGFEVGGLRSGSRWEARSGHAVVRSLNDLDGPRFLWLDERLVKQADQWEALHGVP